MWFLILSMCLCLAGRELRAKSSNGALEALASERGDHRFGHYDGICVYIQYLTCSG